MRYARNLSKEKLFSKLKDRSELDQYFSRTVSEGMATADPSKYCLNRVSDYIKYLDEKLRSVASFDAPDATKTASDVAFDAFLRYIENANEPEKTNAERQLQGMDDLVRHIYGIDRSEIPLEHPEPVVQSFYGSFGIKIISLS